MNTDKPNVFNKSRVGSYDIQAFSGGGRRYDRVLEYRVWTVNSQGKTGLYVFNNYKDAEHHNVKNGGNLVALVEQDYYFDKYNNRINKKRITEWRIEWL